MKRINGYMIPRQKKKVADAYICFRCKKKLEPKDAYFYVDSCNCAITENSLPHCRECYRVEYGE